MATNTSHLTDSMIRITLRGSIKPIEDRIAAIEAYRDEKLQENLTAGNINRNELAELEKIADAFIDLLSEVQYRIDSQ